MPSVLEKGKSMNIDKRTTPPKPVGILKHPESKPAPRVIVTQEKTEDAKIEVKPATLSAREPCADHPLRSLPSSVENSPVEPEVKTSLKIPAIIKTRSVTSKVSPCAVADENR